MPRNRVHAPLLDQEPFRRIYETNVVGLSLSDLDGGFLLANDETLRIIGYDRADLEAGRINWKALTPLEHLHKDVIAVREMQAVGHCAPFEKEYIRKDGTRVAVLVAFSLVEGNLAFGTIVDLTAQREMLRQHSVPGTPKLGMSVLQSMHECNSRLSVILMNAEMALTSASDEKLKRHLTGIVQACREATEINQSLVKEIRAMKPVEKPWSKRGRLYKSRSRFGLFTIAPDPSNPEQWVLSIGSAKLGSYASPVLAADAVLNQKTGFSQWDELAEFHAPADLSGWDIV